MDSKSRFSNRVDNYIKYCPSYPKKAVDFLYDRLGLRTEDTVADIHKRFPVFGEV